MISRKKETTLRVGLGDGEKEESDSAESSAIDLPALGVKVPLAPFALMKGIL